MKVTQLDHLVLTVADVNVTTEFYGTVLGMEKVTFGEGRVALKFGNQKINLHQYQSEFSPHAKVPQPGSADLCFLSDADVDKMQSHLQRCGVEIIAGPVQRTGAGGPIESLYFYDPDGNLIEVSIPIRD